MFWIPTAHLLKSVVGSKAFIFAELIAPGLANIFFYHQVNKFLKCHLRFSAKFFFGLSWVA